MSTRSRQCRNCRIVFARSGAKVNHEKTCSVWKTPYGLQCNFCGELFYELMSMNCHLASHTNVHKLSMCNFCKQDFHSKRRLQKHMGTHDERNINEKDLATYKHRSGVNYLSEEEPILSPAKPVNVELTKTDAVSYTANATSLYKEPKFKTGVLDENGNEKCELSKCIPLDFPHPNNRGDQSSPPTAGNKMDYTKYSVPILAKVTSKLIQNEKNHMISSPKYPKVDIPAGFKSSVVSSADKTRIKQGRNLFGAIMQSRILRGNMLKTDKKHTADSQIEGDRGLKSEFRRPFPVKEHELCILDKCDLGIGIDMEITNEPASSNTILDQLQMQRHKSEVIVFPEPQNDTSDISTTVCYTVQRPTSYFFHAHSRRFAVKATNRPRRPYVCNTCRAGFKDEVQLRFHSRIHVQPSPSYHSNRSDEVCNHGNNTDPSVHNKVKPVGRHLNKEVKRFADLFKPSDKRYTCSLCNQPFRRQVALDGHAKVCPNRDKSESLSESESDDSNDSDWDESREKSTPKRHDKRFLVQPRTAILPSKLPKSSENADVQSARFKGRERRIFHCAYCKEPFSMLVFLCKHMQFYKHLDSHKPADGCSDGSEIIVK